LDKVKDQSGAHKSLVSKGANVELINAMPQGASIGQISVIPPGGSLGQISAISGVSVGQISDAPQGVGTGQIPGVLDKDKGVEMAVADNNVSKGSIPGAFSLMAPLRHEFKAPKQEQSSQPINIEHHHKQSIFQLSLCLLFYNSLWVNVRVLQKGAARIRKNLTRNCDPTLSKF